MFPSPATGETVRWNLDGPLLIAGRPVAPHRFQPHPIDAPPAELLWQHKNPSDAPRDSLSADWSRVGRVLVTAHGDGVVRVWDVDKKAVRTEITPLAPTDGRKRWGLKAAVSPDGKTVAAANVQASAVTLWEADTGKPVATFDEPPGKVTHLRFASDRVLLEARGGGAYSRDLAGDRSKAVKHESVHAELAPAFAFAGGTLATNDGSVVTLKRPTLPGFPAPERGFHSDISGATTESQLAFSPDGRTLAIAGVWPLWPVKLAESGRASRSLWWRSLPDGRTASITALAFFADGRTLAVGGADGLRLYDVESGRERGWYPTLSIRSLAVSGDGEFLAAAMEHGPAVLLWRTADLQPR
jgi:WD40 repeat protein